MASRHAVVVHQPLTSDSGRDELVRALAIAVGNPPVAAAAVDEALTRVGPHRRDPAARAYLRAWRRLGSHAAAPPAAGDRALDTAVAALPPEQRSMLALRHHLGWDADRVGAAHGVDSATVENRLHAAYQVLAGGVHATAHLEEELRSHLATLAEAIIVPEAGDLGRLRSARRSRRMAAATAGVLVVLVAVAWQAGGTGLDIPEPEALQPAPSLAEAPDAPSAVAPAPASEPPIVAGPLLRWQQVSLPTGVRFDHLVELDGVFFGLSPGRDLPGEIGRAVTLWWSRDGEDWSLLPGDVSTFAVGTTVTGLTGGPLGLAAVGGDAFGIAGYGPREVVAPTAWLKPAGGPWMAEPLDAGLPATQDPAAGWVFTSLDVAATAAGVVVAGNAVEQVDYVAAAGDALPGKLPKGFFVGPGPRPDEAYLFGPGGVAVASIPVTLPAGLTSLAEFGHQALVWRTDDGAAWERIDLQAQIGPDAFVLGLQPYLGGFVALGFDTRLGQTSWFSEDGRSWQELEFAGNGPNPVGALAEWGGTTVSRTVGGSVFVSRDGQQWTPVTLPDAQLTRGNGAVVAAGDLGVVIAATVTESIFDDLELELAVAGDGTDAMFDLVRAQVTVTDRATGTLLLAERTEPPGLVDVDFAARTMQIEDPNGAVVFSASIDAWIAAAEDAARVAPVVPGRLHLWYSPDAERWAKQEPPTGLDPTGLVSEAVVGSDVILLRSVRFPLWPGPITPAIELWLGREG